MPWDTAGRFSRGGHGVRPLWASTLMSITYDLGRMLPLPDVTKPEHMTDIMPQLPWAWLRQVLLETPLLLRALVHSS